MSGGGVILTIALGLGPACTEHVQLGGDAKLPGLLSLAVTPPDTAIAFDDLGAPAQHVAYVATGSFEDGTTRDVTALVAWSADNPYPGMFADRGDYLATGTAAGHVGVHATSGDVDGAATLAIHVRATVIDPVFPPPATDLFGDAIVSDDPTKRPDVRYPADRARFPQEMTPIVFQHDRGMNNDTTRLRFSSDVLDLDVITGGDRYQPDTTVWTLIEASHPDSELLLTVEAASSTAPGTVYQAPAITLAFSAGPITDLAYFFSEATLGVTRGSPASPAASLIIGSAADPHHAITRDGRVMALGAGNKLSTVDLDSLSQLLPPGPPMGYAAFSPDGAMVVVADKGTLTLRDAATGAPIGPGGGKLDLGGLKGTHPDWSPDGRHVALAVSDMIDNVDAKRASIARIAYNDGSWGALEILVQSTGDPDNNFAPRWGPDGSIAFVHATSGSKDAKNAELRLLPAGGSTPITLALATTRVGTLEVPDTNVTMPTWSTGADGASWLAFTSTRPYGTIRPMQGAAQIWIAGIDPAREDPSFAGFWLPCQDVTAVNANPIWAPLPIPNN